MKSNAVIVCGSRDGDGTPDGSLTPRALTLWAARYGVGQVVVGSTRGCDGAAFAWATSRGIPATVVVAEWHRFGDAAGPIRNRRMPTLFSIDAVLAFPGGRGTADMIGVAESLGIAVWVWRTEWHEPGWELRNPKTSSPQLALPLEIS